MAVNAIPIGKPFLNSMATPTDSVKYGIYYPAEGKSALQVAFDTLSDLEVLCVGLTVGVWEDGQVKEYQFVSACDSVNDLKLKGGSGTNVVIDEDERTITAGDKSLDVPSVELDAESQDLTIGEDTVHIPNVEWDAAEGLLTVDGASSGVLLDTTYIPEVEIIGQQLKVDSDVIDIPTISIVSNVVTVGTAYGEEATINPVSLDTDSRILYVGADEIVIPVEETYITWNGETKTLTIDGDDVPLPQVTIEGENVMIESEGNTWNNTYVNLSGRTITIGDNSIDVPESGGGAASAVIPSIQIDTAPSSSTIELDFSATDFENKSHEVFGVRFNGGLASSSLSGASDISFKVKKKGATAFDTSCIVRTFRNTSFLATASELDSIVPTDRTLYFVKGTIELGGGYIGNAYICLTDFESTTKDIKELRKLEPEQDWIHAATQAEAEEWGDGSALSIMTGDDLCVINANTKSVSVKTTSGELYVGLDTDFDTNMHEQTLYFYGSSSLIFLNEELDWIGTSYDDYQFDTTKDYVLSIQGGVGIIAEITKPTTTTEEE